MIERKTPGGDSGPRPGENHSKSDNGNIGQSGKKNKLDDRNIRLELYLSKAVSAILDGVADAGSGVRNEALNKAAFDYGRLLNYISRNRAEADLMAAALACGLDTVEAKMTLKSGVDAGLKKPRDLDHIGRGFVGGLSRSYPTKPQQPKQPNPVQERKHEYARQLWQWTKNPTDTPAQIYLKNRGITCPPPANIRFLPWHKHGPSGKQYPILLAKIERQPGSGLQAIQRIFLQEDGKGKASVKPAKMSLGPIKGGAFWIGEPADTLAICEGIEDALSLHMAGYFAAASCGAFNMKNLTIPACVSKIIMAADYGEAGEQQAHKAAQTYLKQGYEVKTAFPPAGQDWNDVLQADNREVGI